MNTSTSKEMLWFILDMIERFDNRIGQVITDWSARSGKDDPVSELKQNQAQATLIIYKLAPCSLLDVADALRISKSSASQLVQRLVEKKMLVRQQDPNNRRKVIIEIEPDVRSRFEEIDLNIQSWMETIARQLGKNNTHQWYEIMKKLQLILEQETDNK